MEEWIALLRTILCAILIIGLAYWFTKYVAGRTGAGMFGVMKGTEQFRALARLSLGRDQALVLVQVGGRYFLLGVTPAAVSNLAEFTKEEAETWPGNQEQPAPPSFGEALRTVLQQKRQR